MLTPIGDMLNWFAAGIVFPLMALPLAVIVAGGRTASTLAWLVIAVGIAGGGVLFAQLAPILNLAPALRQSVVFAVMLAVLFGAIFAAGGASRVTTLLLPPLSAITRTVGRTVMWLLLAMALVQFSVVLLRYVFGVNFIFMQESVTYMHGAVFLLAAGYALLTDDHVRVDIFYREAPARRKALINFLGTYVFLFPICLLLLWTASPYVANSWSVAEGSTETSGIQAVFILKSFIPAFAILLAMGGFVIAARAGEILRERA